MASTVQHDGSDAGGSEAWSTSLFDAHCHPTDTMQNISQIPTMNVNALTIMATRGQDQELVAKVAEDHAIISEEDAISKAGDSKDWRRVVPSFGWHPWFSYQLYDDTDRSTSGPLTSDEKLSHYRNVLTPTPEDNEYLQHLPEPRLLSSFIDETRQRLQQFPLALIGEVGLDRAFRLPEVWLPGQIDSRDPSLTPGGREGRRLSPYKVSQEHQCKVLEAQLRLAGECQRAVSVHGVQAHGVLFETIRRTWRGWERELVSNSEKKRRKSLPDAHDAEAHDTPSGRTTAPPRPYPPRICLHSYSGPPEFLKQYLHPSVPVDFFFSFSIVINFSTARSSTTEEVIRQLPGERILIESDMHIAGAEMEGKLREMARKLCEIKGWSEEDGKARLAKNWRRFVFGGEPD